ncbi:MAG: DNA-protecting protein DprA [Flavobacteriales bacterium]|nr:DNA-protecting protein DprA [Flavobacteriales bacterium]
MLADKLKYQIALTLIPGIGAIAAKKLIAYCGGVEAVFHQKKSHLVKIPSIGEKTAAAIVNSNVFAEAEAELKFIEQNNITAHFYLDKTFPQRLLHCEDSPIILYTKGNMNLNASKTLSIVGTRRATVKGKAITEKLVEELSDFDISVVSGLAYGIDITAHKAALKNGLQTIGVLACGLDEIYPKAHYNTVDKMLNNGGIVSDYKSNTKLFPTQFAERNRIVAGMSDAIIVVESSEKGGSLITADLGNGYNRDVFAFPGRPDDSQSIGCNRLIKTNKAALIESAKDIEYIMGWQKNPDQKSSAKQAQLFVDLTEEEQCIFNCLKKSERKSLDDIALEAKSPISKTTSILLTLEFKGVVRSLPGKLFQQC